VGFEFITNWDWYWYLIILVISASFSYLTYRRNKFNIQSVWYNYPVWLLMTCRFLGTFLILLLLLSPFLKTVRSKTELPIVIIGIDDSKSILLQKDSADYKKHLEEKIKEVEKDISKKFSIKNYLFGSSIGNGDTVHFNSNQTDISGFLENVNQRFGNKNVGAVVLFTDGIFNAGQNPIEAAKLINAPFFIGALGDTNAPKDILIKSVRANKIVYTGNKFATEISLRATGFEGKSAKLSIQNNGSQVFSKIIQFDKKAFYSEENILLEAKAAGLLRYTISIESLPGELNYKNNSYDLFIESLDSKRKILIVGKGPHPDIGAIKQSIERNEDYSVDVFTLNEFLSKGIGDNPNKLKKYQLVIVHQLPTKGNVGLPLIKNCLENNIPLYVIVGAETDIKTFNSLNLGLEIQNSGGRNNEALPSLNAEFDNFNIDPEVSGKMQSFPPLITPFGEYKTSNKNEILLYQMIGKVKSNFPLLMFTTLQNGNKTAILTGEGIWKWFLADYQEENQFKITDEILHKSIQYVSNKTDNRLFRVKSNKNIYNPDEHIVFEAEAYNPNYEPIKNANINLEIINEQGQSKAYTFKNKEEGYELELEDLAPGIYKWKSYTTLAGKRYDLFGNLLVKEVQYEYQETTADHNLLRLMAKETGGKIFYYNNLNDISKQIEENKDIVNVKFFETNLEELIHYKWIFGLILVIFSLEWFVRKYSGSI